MSLHGLKKILMRAVDEKQVISIILYSILYPVVNPLILALPNLSDFHWIGIISIKIEGESFDPGLVAL